MRQQLSRSPIYFYSNPVKEDHRTPPDRSSFFFLRFDPFEQGGAECRGVMPCPRAPEAREVTVAWTRYTMLAENWQATFPDAERLLRRQAEAAVHCCEVRPTANRFSGSKSSHIFRRVRAPSASQRFGRCRRTIDCPRTNDRARGPRSKDAVRRSQRPSSHRTLRERIFVRWWLRVPKLPSAERRAGIPSHGAESASCTREARWFDLPFPSPQRCVRPKTSLARRWDAYNGIRG